MTHYRHLQSLRAIAALLVAYFHAVLQLAAFGDAQPSLPLFGACGVDLFFVISGFVMWNSTRGRAVGPAGFFARRIARIVPLYWIVTLTACAIALVAPQLLRSTKFAFDHAAASLFFIPYPNPGLPAGHPDLLSPVVIPGWTLNFEMAFYLLFGTTLLVRERLRPMLLAVLMVCGLLAARQLATIAPSMAFYANDIALEFLGGVGIALLAERWTRATNVPWYAISLGLVALLLLADLWRGSADRFLLLGIPALLVVAAAIRGVPSAPPTPSMLERLGDASYSIYLLHIFVIAAIRVVIGRIGWHPGGVIGEALFVLLALLLSAFAGLAAHRWIERPLWQWAKRMLVPSAPSDQPRSAA